MIKKTLTLAYGTVAYLLFFAVFNYTLLFIGNIGVSPSLDSLAQTDLVTALLVDLGLLTAFALQHSIMARKGFKRLITRVIPEPIERSTYVLASSVILAALVYYWQPLGGVIWQVENPVAVTILYSLFALGAAMVFIATFLINHADLFGLRQVWLNFIGKRYTALKFSTPWLYRYMRHPLYTGLMIVLWAAPVMTVTHLVFAIACTGYILVGVRFEEKDLEEDLPEYKKYKQEVPMFVPRLTQTTA